MAKPKPSFSPSRFSDKAFKRFMDKITEALNKANVITKAFPILESDSNVPFDIKKTFDNLAALIDNTIVNAQPDFYYSARPDQLDPHV
jgi:hypothetical protein